MALYLLNFSIDSRDAHPDHVAEDLSFNDIESLFEFSLECILNIENAITEHDERDQDHAGSFDFNKIFYQPVIAEVQWKAANFIRLVHPLNSMMEELSNRSLEITSPPPKA